tara:strand:- start:267 stop:371 length:105 start_codon:yes stop_codon:yes gene_type:complete
LVSRRGKLETKIETKLETRSIAWSKSRSVVLFHE